MADYVSNTPISQAIHLPKIVADVDLNGLKFNYDIGMFYTQDSVLLPLKLPPIFDDGGSFR
jgi:hypothetical protein